MTELQMRSVFFDTQFPSGQLPCFSDFITRKFGHQIQRCSMLAHVPQHRLRINGTPLSCRMHFWKLLSTETSAYFRLLRGITRHRTSLAPLLNASLFPIATSAGWPIAAFRNHGQRVGTVRMSGGKEGDVQVRCNAGFWGGENLAPME